MKTTAILVGLLMLTVTRSMAQDNKRDATKENLYAPPALEKPAKLTLKEAPNEIALKRVTLKGPMVALVKSDKPLQTFNPFRTAKNGNGAEPVDFKTDPYVGRPRGIVFFSLGF
jgi:hypothetical protein